MRWSFALLLLAAGCAGPTERQIADRRALSEARPIGPPQDCVTLSSIRGTRVRDDRTIDFELIGGRTLRNTLPNACPQLGFEERFSYSTSHARLCRVDIITVLTPAGRGASCGLGPFQEIVGGERR